jgi:RNA 2',3'-cyclic 3'-phosphodiesterase
MNYPKPTGNRLAPLPGSPRTVRAFFAVWPDRAARDALAELALTTAARAQGRAPRVDNLHLTLAFLVDVAANRIEDLRAIGIKIAAAASPFALTLDRVGAFRDSGIAWAGASAAPQELLRLARTLGAALAANDFPTERREFHPHVTLARRCRKRVGNVVTAPIAWDVVRLTLMASESAPGGARYRELGAAMLEMSAEPGMT